LGAKGVGVGVALGLGVANGPRALADEEHAVDEMTRNKMHHR
jgi:hypothetical protein